MQQKRETLLDKQGRALKLLGAYTAVILLIFAIFIPFLAPGGNKQLELEAETAMTQDVTDVTDVTGTGVVTQSPVNQDSRPDSPPVPVLAAEEKVVTTPVPVTQKAPLKTPAVVDLDKMIWPIKGEVGQQFGMVYSRTYSDYRFHDGIDILVNRGSQIVAVLPGKVIKTETTKSEGTTIIVDHGSGWQSVYSQLEDSFVKAGASVKGSQVIGSVGQSGLSEVLDGPHVHFSLVKDGQEVNPLDYLPQ